MVKSHRCPATVSGTKSAMTTEVVTPWEGAESRSVPRARKPAWFSTEEPFEGKGASDVVVALTPNLIRLGFFVSRRPSSVAL